MILPTNSLNQRQRLLAFSIGSDSPEKLRKKRAMDKLFDY